MDAILQERKSKIDKIRMEYDNRKTQEEIAQLLKMPVADVAKVTQALNYRHTRKATPENRKENERLHPFIDYNEFGFLDAYPLDNFSENGMP